MSNRTRERMERIDKAVRKAIILLRNGQSQEAQVALEEIEIDLGNVLSDAEFFDYFAKTEVARESRSKEELLLGTRAKYQADPSFLRQFGRYLASEEIGQASFILYEQLGFRPYGKKKEWSDAVDELLEAGGGSLEIVEKAAIAAKAARRKDGITLKGPRSIIGYAANELSLYREKAVSKGPKVIRVTGPGIERK